MHEYFCDYPDEYMAYDYGDYGDNGSMYGESEGPEDHFRDDVEADADVLRNAGWGTDEDYGHFGDPYDDWS